MTRDPDAERLEELSADAATKPDALGTDELRPEEETLEYEPPDEPPPEVEQDDPLPGQTKLDERIAQEEPDTG